MADKLANGSKGKAVKNAKVAISSILARNPISGVNTSLILDRNPLYTKSTKIKPVSMNPRTAMTSATGRALSSDLIKVSLIVKPAIDKIIYRPARILFDITTY